MIEAYSYRTDLLLNLLFNMHRLTVERIIFLCVFLSNSSQKMRSFSDIDVLRLEPRK